MNDNDTGLDKAIEGCWLVFAFAVIVFWAGVFAWAYQSVHH